MITINNNMRDAYVYAIKVDGVIRYIGKGSNGRLHKHMEFVQAIDLNPDHARTKHRFQFHRKLHAAWRAGAVIKARKIVVGLTHPQAYRRERLIIAGYRQNVPGQLWNVKAGGGCGEAEFHKLLSKAMTTRLTEQWLDSTYRKRSAARMSALFSKLWADPQWRRRMIAAKRKSITPQVRARLSQAVRASNKRPDVIARRKRAARKMWESPAFRKTMLRILRERAASPKHRALRSQLFRAMWDDPQFRKRMTAIRRKHARDPAVRQRLGDQSRTYWRGNTKARAAQGERMRVSMRHSWTPERRARQAEIMRKRNRRNWRDPVYRARKLASLRAGATT